MGERSPQTSYSNVNPAIGGVSRDGRYCLISRKDGANITVTWALMTITNVTSLPCIANVNRHLGQQKWEY